MATAGPKEPGGTWQARCVTCEEVLAEGQGPTPDTISLAIKEAAQGHQLETSICNGQVKLVRTGRITED